MSDWRVEPDADDAAALAALAADRLWNGYSIADLEPPFRAYSRFALARRPGAAPAAACLILRHPAFSVVVPSGDPAGLAAIFAAVDLPLAPDVHALAQHRPALEQHYRFPDDLRAMLRLAVDRASFRPTAPAPGVERLGAADLPALLDLYAEYPASVFNPDQLASGVFYGLRLGDRLGAAGGTHVLAPRAELAAVGNVYTRPALRGRGYATAVTSALVAELLTGPCRDVVLNVAAGNHAARRIYERLGFRVHCPYLEGRASRRQTF